MQALNLKLRLQAIGDLTKPFKKLIAESDKLNQKFANNKRALGSLNNDLKNTSAYRKLQQQFRHSGSELAKMRERMRGLQQQLTTTRNPSQRLRAEFLKSQTAVKKLERSHRSYMSRLGGLRRFKV